VLPKRFERVKVGRAVPSAPCEVAQTRTFRASADARGALGTARPTADPFGQHALTSSATKCETSRPPAPLPRALTVLILLTLSFSALAADELVPNGGFEKGFGGWTRWGRNANLITLDSALAHSGTNSARIQHGHNALYFTHALDAGQAYELRFAYRLAGGNPSGQATLAFSKKGGGLRSAGAQIFKLAPPTTQESAKWTEFRQVFLPTPVTFSCQFAFAAGDGATLWIDDVSLRAVPRTARLAEPMLPWEG
jgi:hypothetical protein